MLINVEDPGERARLERVVRVIESLPHFAHLRVKVTALEPNRCTMILPYQPEHAGNPDSGILHGGVVTTLLDSAAGLTVFAAQPEGTSVATLDMRIDYLRPAAPGHDLVAETEVYRETRNVAFARGIAYQADRDRPVANCVASFMVGSVGFDPRTARPGDGA